jgi:hypothetical protein
MSFMTLTVITRPRTTAETPGVAWQSRTPPLGNASVPGMATPERGWIAGASTIAERRALQHGSCRDATARCNQSNRHHGSQPLCTRRPLHIPLPAMQ